MAADVIDSPGSYSLDTSISFQDSTTKIGSGGPFRATRLWNDIISHLKDHVEVKRRRVKMRSYDHCFTGTDAVDVVLEQLHAERLNFAKEVSRDKACKLCQLLMDNCVFESVSGRGADETKSPFDDSPSKYYRFVDEKENDCEELPHKTPKIRKSSVSRGPDLGEGGGLSQPVILNKHGQIVQEIMDITGAWKHYSSECLRKKLSPAHLFSRRPSLPEVSIAPQKPEQDHDQWDVSPQVESELWKEVALSQLLTLVELPILDSILSYDGGQKPCKQNLAFSNAAFQRQESGTSLYSNKQDDPWMDAAVECVEFLPKGMDILDTSLSEDTETTQKLRMYQAIADHYLACSTPMWSDHFMDLHLSLFNLLMQGKTDVVQRALCLSLLLLPGHIKEQLKRLLRFIEVACDESAVRLSVKESNRQLLEKVFSSAIIKNKLLTPHQGAQLVMFMVDCWRELFTCPSSVAEVVQQRIDQLAKGNTELPLIDKTYCTRVSQAEFHKQQTELTDRALIDLMNNILDNIKIPLKKKKVPTATLR